MKLPLADQQAPDFWQHAPPEAVRAIEILARRMLETRRRRLNEGAKMNRDDSRD